MQAERGTPIPLPAEYVEAHVQLGYAITAHRAQGAAVDTAHVIAASGMTREAFYVAMTRGRYANHTHVVIENENTSDVDRPEGATASGPREVLAQILARSDQATSAHDTREHLEQEAELWRQPREAHVGQPGPQRALHQHSQSARSSLHPLLHVRQPARLPDPPVRSR